VSGFLNLNVCDQDSSIPRPRSLLFNWTSTTSLKISSCHLDSYQKVLDSTTLELYRYMYVVIYLKNVLNNVN
jgi:hypothetical protein